jgi:hypothetical protein
VELAPEQMLVGDAVALMVGFGLTFKFTDAVATHPNALLPVTE